MKACILCLGVLLVLAMGGNALASELPGLKAVFHNGVELRLDPSTVTEATITPAPVRRSIASRPYWVEFTLTSRAARMYAELTEANFNKPIRFVLDGRVIHEVVLRSRFESGGFLSTKSKSDAIAVLEAMKGYSL